MKFSSFALHQLVVFGASCICLASGSESGGTSSSLRRRELEAGNSTSSCNSTSITWKPGVSLKVTDDNGYSCGLENGQCDVQSPSCSPSFSAMLVRPDEYGQSAVHEVCFDENCILDFSLATASSNSECLTIPDGRGKYRGLMVRGTSPTIEAEVFADGEVICSGEAQPSCRTDYSWLPGMTLEVSTEDGKCESVAGCSINATLSDAGVCSIYPGSIVMARPSGYPDHTVTEVYSSAWNGPVTSFYAALAGASNNEDCLKDGKIKLSSNPGNVVQAVVSEDGSVYCRSLVAGESCMSSEQCLEGNCEGGKCFTMPPTSTPTATPSTLPSVSPNPTFGCAPNLPEIAGVDPIVDITSPTSFTGICTAGNEDAWQGYQANVTLLSYTIHMRFRLSEETDGRNGGTLIQFRGGRDNALDAHHGNHNNLENDQLELYDDEDRVFGQNRFNIRSNCWVDLKITHNGTMKFLINDGIHAVQSDTYEDQSHYYRLEGVMRFFDWQDNGSNRCYWDSNGEIEFLRIYEGVVEDLTAFQFI